MGKRINVTKYKFELGSMNKDVPLKLVVTRVYFKTTTFAFNLTMQNSYLIETLRQNSSKKLTISCFEKIR